MGLINHQSQKIIEYPCICSDMYSCSSFYAHVYPQDMCSTELHTNHWPVISMEAMQSKGETTWPMVRALQATSCRSLLLPGSDRWRSSKPKLPWLPSANLLPAPPGSATHFIRWYHAALCRSEIFLSSLTRHLGPGQQCPPCEVSSWRSVAVLSLATSCQTCQTAPEEALDASAALGNGLHVCCFLDMWVYGRHREPSSCPIAINHREKHKPWGVFLSWLMLQPEISSEFRSKSSPLIKGRDALNMGRVRETLPVNFWNGWLTPVNH